MLLGARGKRRKELNVGEKEKREVEYLEYGHEHL